MTRKQASSALALHLDATVVHEVGFTITLFRQKGLPRPSNCPAASSASSLSPADVKGNSMPVEVEDATTVRLPRQRTSAKSAERAAAGKAEAKKRPKGPAEFSVLK